MNKADLEKIGLTSEALEKAGLTADVLDKIIVAHGKDIESHKGKLSTAQTEIDSFKKQLEDANKQIEGFKGMDIETIKKTADDYKTKFEQAQADAAVQLTNLKFDHALQGALTGAKARNPIAVQALLKKDALKLNDDGTILGLKEQLETIQKDNDYLFESANPPPRIVTNTNNQPITGNAFVDAARRGAKLPLPEQGK